MTIFISEKLFFTGVGNGLLCIEHHTIDKNTDYTYISMS